MACVLEVVSITATGFSGGAYTRFIVRVRGCKAKINVAYAAAGATGARLAEGTATTVETLTGVGTVYRADIALTAPAAPGNCNRTVKVTAVCVDDPACRVVGERRIQCDDAPPDGGDDPTTPECPPDGSRFVLRITLPSGDAGPAGTGYTKGQIEQMADDPSGPGCNIQGTYRIVLVGLDAGLVDGTSVQWRVFDTIAETTQVVKEGIVGVDATILQLDYLHSSESATGCGASEIQVALSHPTCPYSSAPTVQLKLCCTGCESQGMITDPTGACVSPCKSGFRWDSAQQRCVKEGPSDPGGGRDDGGDGSGRGSVPPPLCSCDAWWCYPLMLLLAPIIGAFIFAVTNCMDGIGIAGAAALAAIAGFRSACGPCCTRCLIWIGIIAGIILVIIKWIYSGPPGCITNGAFAVAALAVLAETNNDDCNG